MFWDCFEIVGDYEVKVGIKVVGICGSDVYYYRVGLFVFLCVFILFYWEVFCLFWLIVGKILGEF